MVSFNNNDLYQMLLDRLRKDRKGSVSPEEFESFLRWRNLDYFNKQLGSEGATKLNYDSLVPFMFFQDDIAISTSLGEHYVILDSSYVGPSATYKVAHIANAWYSASATDHSSKVNLDIVSFPEWRNRLGNAITGPTNTYPIGCRGMLVIVGLGNMEVLWVEGGSDVEGGVVILDYYKYPADPYFDYYTDAYGNITYLTDGQAAYTLLTGEISRSNATAGTAVTSASQDLEWEDSDALHILDMIVTDVSVALSDPDSVQASLFERQQNVSK